MTRWNLPPMMLVCVFGQLNGSSMASSVGRARETTLRVRLTTSSTYDGTASATKKAASSNARDIILASWTTPGCARQSLTSGLSVPRIADRHSSCSSL
ncbi:hypothetical protein H4582DRAFT_1894300, partial [Lactarius indigo]